MKNLLNNIITALEDAITAGDINAAKVFKGYRDNPENVPFGYFPYISVDEAGERTTEEGVESDTAINRIYSVAVEMAVYSYDKDAALDGILDLSNEVKTVLELESNRFKDGYIFGVNIIPFEWQKDERTFFRGRQVITEYWDLEDKFFEY